MRKNVEKKLTYVNVRLSLRIFNSLRTIQGRWRRIPDRSSFFFGGGVGGGETTRIALKMHTTHVQGELKVGKFISTIIAAF